MSLSKPVINIIKRDASGSPVLDEENLKQLLINTQAKNIPVAFYSICGSARLGKSFLWNQFVRYLNDKHMFLTNLDSTENLEKFFEWKGGDDRHTDGILVYKHPFILRTPDYDKIALFLMDTQGMFDNIESGANGGMIFTLSFLISSLQVYNVQSKLESTQLQNSYKAIQILESVRKSESGTTPFQSLMFLVRDWKRKKLHSLGLKGGKEFIDNWLKSKDTQADDQRDVRKEIQNNIKKISGFLLPEPGEEVIDMDPETSDCRIKDVGEQFYTYINNLFQHLCQQGNIVLKTVDGEVQKGKKLYDHIVLMAREVAKFSGVKDAFGTFVTNDYQAEMRIVTYRALKMYIERVCAAFQNHVKNEDGTYNRSELTQQHHNLKNAAIEKFNNSPKPGEEEFHNRWRKVLDDLIEKNYNKFKECVESEEAFHIALRDYNEVLRSHAEGLENFAKRVFSPKDEAKKRSKKALDDAIKKIKKMVGDDFIAEQCCSKLKKVADKLLEEHLSRINKIIAGVAVGGILGALGGIALGVYLAAELTTGLVIASSATGGVIGLGAGVALGSLSSYVLVSHRDPLEQMIKMSWGQGGDDLSCIEAEIVLGLSYEVVRFRMENVP